MRGIGRLKNPGSSRSWMKGRRFIFDDAAHLQEESSRRLSSMRRSGLVRAADIQHHFEPSSTSKATWPTLNCLLPALTPERQHLRIERPQNLASGRWRRMYSTAMVFRSL